MTTFDELRPEKKNYLPRWRKPLRWLRRRMPRRLYTRALLIIIVPIIILEAVVAYVFMERHWQLVTSRLSIAVTHDIAALIEIMRTYPHPDGYETLFSIAREKLDYDVRLEDGPLPPPLPPPFFSILDEKLGQEIASQIGKPYWIDTFGQDWNIEIRILLDDGKVLRVEMPRQYAYATNSHIFIVWMVAISLVLITIAIFFLRGQIRPILQLADAAENFGKGQKTPEGFTLSGADEVRKASLAFILMRERIERQIEQRTAMLTGVSHDLRTILTRFKLQLAILDKNEDLEELSKDVEDMQAMLEGYMAFARGETEDEAIGTVSLDEVLSRFETQAELENKQLTFEIEGDDEVQVRPNAFGRLISNLISNALQHANEVTVSVHHTARWLVVIVEDNGPGIPEDMREDVFKPFFRLDKARNLNKGGTGLGLSIARDIARSHGGNITLSTSAAGGLRAEARMPV